MKKNKTIKIVIPIIVILFALGFYFSTGLFSVISTQVIEPISAQFGDTESLLYNYQCIDVTEWKAKGYTTDKIDERGCEVVGKNVVLYSINLGFDASYDSRNRISQGEAHCQERVGIPFYEWTYCNGNDCRYKATMLVCAKVERYQEGGAQRIVNQCDYGANDIIWAQTFSEGVYQISEFDYQPKSFCRALTAIVSDAGVSEGIASSEVYQQIADDGYLNVPQGKEVLLFYITEKNGFLEDNTDLADKINQINELNEQIAKYDLDISILSTTLTNLQLERADLISAIDSLELTNAELGVVIDDLQVSNSEKLLIIDGLEKDIEAQKQIAENLRLTLEEEKQVVQSLSGKIDEQKITINLMSDTLTEQAVLIQEMQLSIEQQNYYINELTDNIEEKAQIIRILSESNIALEAKFIALEKEVEIQAELASQFKSVIEEDKQLISNISTERDVQAQLISNMGYNIAELTNMTFALEIQIDEMQGFVDSLTISNEKKTQLVNEYLTIIEDYERKLANLETLNDADATKIAYLKKITTDDKATLQSLQNEYNSLISYVNMTIYVLIGIFSAGIIATFILIRRKK